MANRTRNDSLLDGSDKPVDRRKAGAKRVLSRVQPSKYRIDYRRLEIKDLDNWDDLPAGKYERGYET